MDMVGTNSKFNVGARLRLNYPWLDGHKDAARVQAARFLDMMQLFRRIDHREVHRMKKKKGKGKISCTHHTALLQRLVDDDKPTLRSNHDEIGEGVECG